MIKKTKQRLKRFIVILSYLFFIILVLLFSELLYVYKNQPVKLAQFFLFLAQKEVKAGMLEEAIINLDEVASIYIKENQI